MAGSASKAAIIEQPSQLAGQTNPYGTLSECDEDHFRRKYQNFLK
jgi:hypothetical protein